MCTKSDNEVGMKLIFHQLVVTEQILGHLIFNPLVTNGLSHSYHLDEFTFILRGIRSDFPFLFHFSMNL